MKKKNTVLVYTLFVFSFLYSGTVISCPFYMLGEPVMSYLITSAFLGVYTFAAVKYFSVRRYVGRKKGGIYFAVLMAVLAVVPASLTACLYADSFGVFADYYAEPFTKYFALAALIFCSVYGAFKGRAAVSGFAGLAVPLLIMWTAAGFFAFFTTKQIVPLENPLKNLSDISVLNMLKGIGYFCFDITFISVMLPYKGDKEVASAASKGILYGVEGYILIAGINLLRNLFLFGEDFALSIPNPDLAAIRLIPMFDLPEISIVVNTFACAVKLSVYFLFAVSVLVQAFDDIKRKKYSIVLCSLCIAFCVFINITGIELALIRDVSAVCTVMCTALCFIFRGFGKMEQNNVKKDSGL